jgi:hypothetical protein
VNINLKKFILLLAWSLSASAQTMFDQSNYELTYIKKIQDKLANTDLDFRLLDQFGTPFSLVDFNDTKKSLIVSFDPFCKGEIILQKIEDEAKKNGITSIILIDSKTGLTRETIIEHFPNKTILLDEFQQIAGLLEFKNSGDYIVYDHSSGKILKRIPSAESCPITFMSYQKNSFQKEIFPAFERACLQCHNKMKSFNYFDDLKQVQHWQKMMQKTIRLKRMPPGADPYYSELISGHTNEDILKISQWLEAGAPYTAEDADFYRQQIKNFREKKKDIIAKFLKTKVKLISFPSEIVPESGGDFYKHYRTKKPTTEDIYFRDFSVLFNENVAHHLALHYSPKPFPDVDKKGRAIDRKEQMVLYGNNKITVEGTIDGKKITGNKFTDPNVIQVARQPGHQKSSDGTYYFIPKGSYLNFEVHYNPDGVKEISPVKLFITPLKNGEPFKVIKRFSLSPENGTIVARAHERSLVKLNYRTEKNMLLKGYGLHMHYRGKYGKVYLQKQDEKIPKLIISFPTYQYRNQVTSIFKEGIYIPKNSTLFTEIFFDNSDKNLTNPNVNEDVRIGTSVAHEENYLPRFMYLEQP